LVYGSGLGEDWTSEAVAGLARAEHPQHQYVAGGLVTAGVGENLIERSVTTVAGQLAHARMLANRIEARPLLQLVDRCSDRPAIDQRLRRPRRGESMHRSRLDVVPDVRQWRRMGRPGDGAGHHLGELYARRVDRAPYRIAAVLPGGVGHLSTGNSAESQILVEVWLPESGWNGRYLGTGNGGFAGAITPAALEGGLLEGYAVANTDMGTGVLYQCNVLYCGGRTGLGGPADPYRPPVLLAPEFGPPESACQDWGFGCLVTHGCTVRSLAPRAISWDAVGGFRRGIQRST
jgi:hypothetical protein